MSTTGRCTPSPTRNTKRSSPTRSSIATAFSEARRNCIDKLRELEKLGVSRFCAYLVGLEDQDEILEQVRLWGEEIIPEFS